MSERLNSAEIEDVLSSIRRLVSEDLRPVPKVEPAPLREADEGPGKLLLTPALRIMPAAVVVGAAEADAEEEAMEAPPAAFHSVRAEAESGRLVLMGEVARSLDGATDEDVLSPAPASGMPAWFGEAEPEVVPEAAPVAAPEEVAEVVPAVDVAEGWQAAVDMVVEPVAEPAVPAALETEVDALHWAARGMSEAEEAALAARAGESDPVPSAVEGAMAADEPADLPEWARMEVEAPQESEVVTGQQEVDVVAGPQPAADPDWVDAAEAEIRRELEQEAEATVFSRFDALEDGASEPIYDEEMLRDLVRDIIREELQGALGERITRNVRKLVRAEIARALAVRDFE